MNNNCVIYARFSSHGQNEQSIESQIRTCKEFADSKGYNVIGIYSDKAKTGTNDKRPDFQRMMKDAQSGTFGYIIVYMMDRFSRSRKDSIMYKEMLKEKFGIKVLSALEPISDDEGGEFYEMFLEWNAEKYSKRLSKRIRDGIDTSVRNGTYCGGRLIYGYKLIDTEKTGKKGIIHKVEINDEEAEVVRFIFENYANGVPKKKIAETLNDKGHRLNGKKFTFRMFKHWLVNEKYTGEFTFGGRVCTNVYPQIIDKALFKKVQDKLSEKRYVSGGENTAKVPYLLTGKLYCGHCGTKMIADGGTSKKGVKYYYYACKKIKAGECNKHRERKDVLEQTVVSFMFGFLSDKDNMDTIANDVIAYYDKRTDESNLKSINAKIAAIQADVERLTDSYVTVQSTLLRNSIEKKMADYEVLLNDLYTQKVKLEMERGYKLTKEDILDFVKGILKTDNTDKDFQKRIIDVLVKKVIVYDGHVAVFFNINGESNILTEDISVEDFRNALDDMSDGVQTPTPTLRQWRNSLNTLKCVQTVTLSAHKASSYLLPSIISIDFIDGDAMITVRMDEKPPSYLTQRRDEHDNYTK